MAERLAAVRAAVTGRRGAPAAIAVLCALIVSVTLVVGSGASEGRSAPTGAGTTAGPQSTPDAPATTVGAAAEDLRRLAELPGTSASTRLHVPAIGIDAPVVPVPLQDGGALDPPQDVTAVGWWDGSAEAGDGTGQTVLTGHTVHDGGGVMDDLDTLRAGDQVRVTGPDGHVDYAVTEVVTWTKAELTENAVEAFGQDRHHGRLVLVTCEDWSGVAYESNVVAFAEPVGVA
jgi:LPXTG-site transpeptidase (sortase) family protein